MMLVLRFSLEKLEKLNFQRISPEFFDGTFRDFFFRRVPKNGDRNWDTNEERFVCMMIFLTLGSNIRPLDDVFETYNAFAALYK